MTQPQIKKLANKLNVHPIHIRVCMANMKNPFNPGLVENEFGKNSDISPKPFVKWVGGKRQLLKQFKDRNLYPPDDFDPKKAMYFEPFVGGGAMFFDLKLKKAILSDMNSELVTTYNIIKSDVDDLIKRLKEHKKRNNKEYFLKIRFQNVKKLSDVNVAARFVYLNRTCFNGLYRVNRKGQFNVPYGKNKNPLICDEKNLRKAHKSMKRVRILKQDYKKVLRKAQKGDFVYFDPPYYPINKTSSFTNYTKDAFLEKEQIELRDTFLELHKRECFVMLSNSNTPFIRELYSGLGEEIKIHKVFASRAINSRGNGRGKIKEVVVINY